MPIDFASIAARYGLPPDVLAALIQQESGGNPLAMGDNGNSFGLGQFNTRGALADLGLTPQQVLAMPAEQQADLTAKFLATKVQQAGGDLWGGVKRYNGGGDPNYVQNVKRRMPGGVDVRQAALAPQPGTMSTDTPPEPVTGDPVTGLLERGRAAPSAYPTTLAESTDVYAAQQELEALRGRFQQAQAPAYGLPDLIALGLSMANGANPIAALGDWSSARTSMDEREFKRRQQAALDMGQSAKLEAAIADLEDRQARKRWANSLPPEDRALAQAGYGSEVAKALLSPKENLAPTMKEVQVGDRTITLQWNPQRRGWDKVGEAPRWQPAAPAKPLDLYGTPPSGSKATTDPQTGDITGYVPLPGSPEAFKRTNMETAAKNVVVRITDLLNMFDDPGGFDMYGQRGGDMAALRGSIISDVATIRGMGVLDQKEREQLDKELADPTSFMAGSFGRNSPEYIKAAFQRLRVSAIQDYQAKGGTMTPELQRYLTETAAASPDDEEIARLRAGLPGGAGNQTRGGF